MFKEINLSGVDALEKETNIDNPCVIILHGYGASKDDLAPLVEYIPGHENYNWIFPNGIIDVAIGPNMSGRAWFPIDMIAMEEASRTGNFSARFKDIPEGFYEAKEKVSSFIKELKKKYNKLIIGGFSQGSMMAIDLAFGGPSNFGSIILMSSTLVAPDNWKKYFPIEIPVFQSHGIEDSVLPINGARELKTFLKEKNANIDYHEFTGGHEIPIQVIHALGAFLERNRNA